MNKMPHPRSMASRLRSMTFEIIEWFPAFFTPVQRLAGRTAEFTDHSGMIGAAPWAGDRFFPVEQCRMADRLQRSGGRDAVLSQFFFSVLTHPVGSPGGGQHSSDRNRSEAMPDQCHPDIHTDNVHGGTAAVGRGNDQFHGLIL